MGVQDLLDLVHDFYWKLAATPFGLDRASLHVGTLHPELLGYAWNWLRDDGLTDEVQVAPEVLDTDAYKKNPLFRAVGHGERFQAIAKSDEPSPLLADLWRDGFTEYRAMPLNATDAHHNAGTLATRRAGGFDPDDAAALDRLMALFALHVERHIAAQISRNALAAYLGPQAGAEVLAGSIHRGDGRAIRAVIWMSDLRGFTALSDRLAGEEMTALLNAYFERMVGAVLDAGGEVLKFIGDGLLAVFPLDSYATPTDAAAAALRAAMAALDRQQALNDDPDALVGIEGWRPLASGVALHDGEVFFGNVGGPGRLDFTATGAAVNVAARVETLTKTVDRPILMTEPVAKLLGGTALDDLGPHDLRGLSAPIRIFAPAQAT